MGIIHVVQRHRENIERIRDYVNCIGTSNDISYFSNPEIAIRAARANKPDIAVSGNVFESEKYPSAIGYARDLKLSVPGALFFLYSTEPVEDELFDGIIPKQNGTAVDGSLHKNLASLLTSDSITELARRRDFAELKRQFPFLELRNLAMLK